MNILVADDAPESRRFLEVLLGRWNHEVVSVADGGAALEMLRAGKFSLAFLDWEMPVLDGPGVCRAVREDPSLAERCYLILLTGRAEGEDIAKGLDAGADDYLIKPVDAQALRARLGIAERFVTLWSELEALRGGGAS